ncbi:hypothetical protein BN1321_130041 [Staphylococcus aureus]|uniref:Uncharacterized protein n=1 Tax=Staphylococcus aureus TaxID=1280 RepID=A0A0U1MFX9_STAAU|nr:hypothetical protein BN1321_130041 [Staphylococcus aureus]
MLINFEFLENLLNSKIGIVIIYVKQILILYY